MEAGHPAEGQLPRRRSRPAGLRNRGYAAHGLRHPAVLGGAGVGQPDPKWGETPCAFVEVKPDAAVTEAELIEHCRRLLARFKARKKVIFGELPKTSTGKIQKFVLRERAKSTAAI